MAPSTERSPLIGKDPESKARGWTTTNVTIIVHYLVPALFQIFGVIIPLIMYCKRTYYCGINEKRPFYRCQNYTTPERDDGFQEFKIFELFGFIEVIIQLVIVGFCCGYMVRQMKMKNTVWELIKLSQTWPLLGSLVLCEFRFIFILHYVNNENEVDKGLAMSVIVMYMINAILITALVALLHFVKLRDLAANMTGEDEEIFRIRCVRVTEKQLLFYLLKFYLFIFWLKYFVYCVVVLFQIYFDVVEVNQKFVGEDGERAVNLLKKAGQSYFMYSISGYFWTKLFDDDCRILGVKSGVTTETRGTETEDSSSASLSGIEVQSSLRSNYESCQSSLASFEV